MVPVIASASELTSDCICLLFHQTKEGKDERVRLCLVHPLLKYPAWQYISQLFLCTLGFGHKPIATATWKDIVAAVLDLLLPVNIYG